MILNNVNSFNASGNGNSQEFITSAQNNGTSYDKSTENGKVKIIYTNADTLTNKMEELLSLIEIEKPDVIGITETLPKNRINGTLLEQLIIPGYDIYTIDPENHEGRGIAIYVNQNLISSEISITDDVVESIWCKIKLKDNDSLMIGCVYRSPSGPPDTYKNIDRMIKEACDMKSSHLLIMGDFNYKEINWENSTTSVSENHPASLFLEVIRDRYLYQQVRHFTRIRGAETPHLLDLVFTNEENMIDEINYLPGLGKSDHLILQFNLECYTTNNTSSKRKYNYFKADYEVLSAKLNAIDWQLQMDGKNTSEMWECFTDNINQLVEENVPVCKTNPANRPKTPWINEPALASIRHKRCTWKKYMHCRTDHNYTRYLEARNRATNDTKKAKYSYEHNIAENIKEDNKSFWKYVRSKSKTKVTINELENEDGTLTTDSVEKARILNKYFVSVFTNENTDSMPDFRSRHNGEPLENIEVNDEAVNKIAKKLKPEKSQGPDGIHPKFIKETIDTLDKQLSNLFNNSIQEGTVPTDWRKANISAIHKKGSKKKAQNYRPISLTSIICKMLERTIRDSIVEHMEQNKLFSIHQHGFRKGHSCVTQLIEVLDQWTEYLDHSENVDTVFLDFKKAFDTVPHQRLLLKLKGYKIEGKVIDWIESFLKDRTQRVVVNGEQSEWSNVASGIPQGSVLGPVLFLIYINDLPDTVNNIVKLFADDTKIFGKSNSEEDVISLQNDLDKLCDWSRTWQLEFNSSKCKVMHLGNQQEHAKYFMQDGQDRKEITEVCEEKDLGVLIDNKLKFSQHIHASVKKANRVLGLIKKTFSYMDKIMFLQLYKSLVRPHLEYGSQAWSVIYKKESVVLENVQRRATKLIKGICEKTYTQRLKDLGLPSLQYRRARADMVQVYKIINNIDQVDKDRITPIIQTRTRGHKYKIFKRQVRLDIRKYSFSQRVVNSWNELPETVVNAETLNQFKSRLNNAWKDIEIKFAPNCY